MFLKVFRCCQNKDKLSSLYTYLCCTAKKHRWSHVFAPHSISFTFNLWWTTCTIPWSQESVHECMQ